VQAGAENLEFLWPDERLVQFKIHVECGEARTPDHMIVLVERFIPRAEAALPEARAPRSMKVKGTSAWPPELGIGYCGGGPNRSEKGYSRRTFYDTREIPDHSVPPLQEGWYRIGLQTFGGDRRQLPSYPLATDFHYFEDGEYDITFLIQPAGSLEIRLRWPGRPDDLCYALADLNGSLLAVEGVGNRMKKVAPVPPDGAMAIQLAPAGEFLLRLGTQEGLPAGQYLLEKRVTLRPGTNPLLEIEGP